MKKITEKIKAYKNLSYLILSISTLCLVSVFYSCGANIFSVNDDVSIGRDLDKQIRNDRRQFPILQGHDDVRSYVSGIGRGILNYSSLIKYKNVFPYQFEVIEDDSTVNAFCVPGGYIYVYTGLIKFVDNEASLAGVLAHEIAHAERRHMTQRLTSYYGVSAILSLVLGNNPNQVAEIAANLFVGLGFLANSRADETEADDYSIKYLRSSQYYPGSIIFFFNKIREEQKKKGTTPGSLDRLFATHPLPQDRIDNVFEELAKINPRPDSTKGLYPERYQEIKAKLQ
ncbi:MAG: M48 family metalloprotease [Bacteroidetes bacterium]|nr:M48 family metalloprotease [Bacteroidota bacterium]MBX7045215.1 M48 family metalloprotease [Ignavibacteria bacterium]